MDELLPRRRRAPSDDLLVARAARKLVASTQRRLGDWRAEAVKLEVIRQRRGMDGPVAERLSQLCAEIAAEQERLGQVIAAEANTGVVRHSYVADAQQALAALSRQLQAALDDGC